MTSNKYTSTDISNVHNVPLKDVFEAIKTLGLSQPLTKEEVDSVVAHLGDKIPPREKVYTKDEAAKKLGVSKDTLSNKLKKGELDGEAKRLDPFGYFDDIPLLKTEKIRYVTLENAIALAKQAAEKAYNEGYKAGVESIEVVEIANIGDLSGFGGVG